MEPNGAAEAHSPAAQQPITTILIMVATSPSIMPQLHSPKENYSSNKMTPSCDA